MYKGLTTSPNQPTHCHPEPDTSTKPPVDSQNFVAASGATDEHLLLYFGWIVVGSVVAVALQAWPHMSASASASAVHHSQQRGFAHRRPTEGPRGPCGPFVGLCGPCVGLLLA